ncbi:hypothetical protein Tco_1517543 [Tanacetum coccineum]
MKRGKVENATAEMLRGLDQLMERKEDGDYKMEKLARLYIDEIVAGHEVPVTIISDREGRFTSRVLANITESLRDAIGYEYGLSSSDGRTKVEVCDKVMLEVSSWKDVVHFGKKEMLAPRYYWTDANLHAHLEEIKVDKTLCFVEEPVEIIDCEVKSLKRSRIPIVKSIRTRSEVMRIS